MGSTLNPDAVVFRHWPSALSTTLPSWALAYLALEPYARRIWPTMLTSWSRLVGGEILRWRDASVGRSVLWGLAAGAVLTALVPLRDLVNALAQGGVVKPPIGNWNVILGQRMVLAEIVNGLQQGATGACFFTLLLIGLRFIVRRRLPTVIVTVALLSLLGAFDDKYSSVPIGFMLEAVVLTSLVVVLVRFGFLSLMVATFVATLAGMAATADWTAWYARPSWTAMILVTLLASLRLLVRHLRSPPDPRREVELPYAIPRWSEPRAEAWANVSVRVRRAPGFPDTEGTLTRPSSLKGGCRDLAPPQATTELPDRENVDSRLRAARSGLKTHQHPLSDTGIVGCHLTQTLQVVARHPCRGLDLDRDRGLPDDEVDFGPSAELPVSEIEPLLRIGTIRGQLVKDPALERLSVEFPALFEAATAGQFVDHPDVGKVELRSVRHATLGAADVGGQEAPQQRVLQDLVVGPDGGCGNATLPRDVGVVEDFCVANRSDTQEVREVGEATYQSLRGDLLLQVVVDVGSNERPVFVRQVVPR